jgi:uncharacterized protein YjbI with pentapeptide repeats
VLRYENDENQTMKNFLLDQSITIQLVKCKFTTAAYLDFDIGGRARERTDYECEKEEDILKSGLCIFHDENYLRDETNRAQNQQNVIGKLMAKVRQKIEKKEPLFCIGYYLPSVRINEVFTKPVYFSKCIFSGSTDFDGAEFSGGETSFIGTEFSGGGTYFSEAKFSGGGTSFSGAKFSGSTTFSRAKFSGTYTSFRNAEFSGGGTYFIGTEFSGGGTYFSGAKFSGGGTSFHGAKFSGMDTSFRNAEFSGGGTSFDEAEFSEQASFSWTDFKEEVTFDKTFFPPSEADIDSEETSAKPTQEQYKTIPIKFDYCKFRKTVQFIGKSEKKEPLQLGLVSFKGVDLSNVEFHNVKWQEIKEPIFITRNVIVDEKMLYKNGNYEEVSKIYNQLRKNYESKLLFNEASNFFIGEMEAIRKSLLHGSARQKLSSIPYSLYKGLAMYGESYFLPLIIWTPAIILGFFALRFCLGICSVQPDHVAILPVQPVHPVPCSPWEKIVDSFAAYFQFPRSSTNIYDTVERIVSIPILGTAFIAVRRKFERIK